MNKWLKAFVIVIVIWLMLTAVKTLASSSLTLWSNIFQLRENLSKGETLTYPCPNLEEISIKSINGNIILLGEEECSEIVIEVKYTASGKNRKDAEDKLQTLSTILREEVKGKLTINASFPKNMSNNSISYTVYLPSNLKVEASTTNGRIDGTNLEGQVKLNSSNGNITVNSSKGPQELVARTTNGRLNIKGRPSTGSYDLHTSNGPIQIHLPKDLGITFSARTSNGRINLGTGQWLIEEGALNKNSLKAKRDDGYFQLKARTSNGNITLATLE